MTDLLKYLSGIDLGQALLSIAIVIGFLLTLAVVFRSIELPIRIYLDKRKKQKDSLPIEESDSGTGF